MLHIILITSSNVINYIVIMELNMTTSYIPKKSLDYHSYQDVVIFPLTPCYFNEAVVKNKSKRERKKSAAGRRKG